MVDHVTLNATEAGDGGNGGAGAPGGLGGAGGAGGAGATCSGAGSTVMSGPGAPGGDGGQGVTGGAGGGGNGGSSSPLVLGPESNWERRELISSAGMGGRGGFSGPGGKRAAEGSGGVDLINYGGWPQPVGDYDEDGVLDGKDLCLADPGPGTTTGCPEGLAPNVDLRYPYPYEPPPAPVVEQPKQQTTTVVGQPTRVPTVMPAPAVPNVTFSVHKLTAKGTRLSKLSVAGIPSGATVTVSCKGHGCPKRFVKRNASGTLNVAAYVRKTFRPKTVIRVGISKPGMKTVVSKITIRKRATPVLRTA